MIRLDAGVSRHFSDRAPWYATAVAPCFESARAYVARRAVGRGAAVLVDVGAGDGRLAAIAEPSERRVVCVDISEPLLRQAATVPGALPVRADAGRLPFGDAVADMVCCVATLPLLPDVPRAVREMVRICAPHGEILIATVAAMYLRGLAGARQPARSSSSLVAAAGAVITERVEFNGELSISEPVSLAGLFGGVLGASLAPAAPRHGYDRLARAVLAACGGTAHVVVDFEVLHLSASRSQHTVEE